MKNFYPQKWPAENPDLPKPKAGTYKEHKLLADEFALPIDELAARYPPPRSDAAAAGTVTSRTVKPPEGT